MAVFAIGIWSSAKVNVPPDTSNVFPEPTVTSEVAIVVPSIVPESISTLEIFTSPLPFGVRLICPLVSEEIIVLPLMLILST